MNTAFELGQQIAYLRVEDGKVCVRVGIIESITISRNGGEMYYVEYGGTYHDVLYTKEIFSAEELYAQLGEVRADLRALINSDPISVDEQ